MSDTIRPSEISEVLLDQLKAISDDLRYEEVGKVLQVSDGVVRIYGLLNAEAGELLEFVLLMWNILIIIIAFLSQFGMILMNIVMRVKNISLLSKMPVRARRTFCVI